MEKEFVSPKFDTVVVTKQPNKLKITTNVEVAGVCHVAQDETVIDNNDCGSVDKNENVEKYKKKKDDDEDDNDDDRTAVRTLAANTGSVAILGTTAKCKSRNGAGQPQLPSSAAVDDHQTTNVASVIGKLEEKVAAIDLQPQFGLSSADLATDPNSCREVVIYCVEATPIRRLAAETGSIAILVSTVVCPPKGKFVEDVGSEELDRLPVDVVEALDTVERDRSVEAKPRPTTIAESENGDPLIPVPVVNAMTVEHHSTVTVSNDHVPEPKLKSVPSLTADKEKPHSITTCCDGDLCHVDSHASSRSPLVRQSIKIADQNEYDGFSPPDKWFPKVPVFAKCLPPKSKSKSKYYI